MAKVNPEKMSEDARQLEFDQGVVVTYHLGRFLKEGIDTISCVGEVDLSGFSERPKKVTVANIQLPLQDAIKFADQLKDFCLTSDAPPQTSGLSNASQRREG